MTIKKYRITLQHDHGKTRIITCASSKKQALNIIQAFEKCPLQAITKIETIKQPTKEEK